MGIRMLNHRPAVSPTAVGAAPAAPPPPVPALAADASTARIPPDLAAAVRRAVTGLRRRAVPGESRPWRMWADLTRGYVALLLARLPQPAPARTVTVFVAAPIPRADRTDRPLGPPAHRPRPDGRPGRDEPARRDESARRDGPSRRDEPSLPDEPSRHDRRPQQNGQNRPGQRDW
ncbi:hypothetical protein [Streptomyces sp. MK5]|uniref:hypothetical protein n=1 Tax=Streptomyces sp. MK5 TaxID=3064253 RepID=UPI0027408E0A|nr:hypothetical protein [Streptomyces sp. MK5]